MQEPSWQREPQLLRVWELGRTEQKEKLNSVAAKASANPAGKYKTGLALQRLFSGSCSTTLSSGGYNLRLGTFPQPRAISGRGLSYKPSAANTLSAAKK